MICCIDTRITHSTGKGKKSAKSQGDRFAPTFFYHVMQPESGQWAIVPIDIIIERECSRSQGSDRATAQEPGFFDNFWL
ncbi:MAG: hypothetical protein MUE44_22565 [Oscillatoriaceae cyanobacterium Prado104]|nr:hypothetical protein [Oscillatoriaceae cyanobacterium Prado104]